MQFLHLCSYVIKSTQYANILMHVWIDHTWKLYGHTPSWTCLQFGIQYDNMPLECLLRINNNYLEHLMFNSTIQNAIFRWCANEYRCFLVGFCTRKAVGMKGQNNEQFGKITSPSTKENWRSRLSVGCWFMVAIFHHQHTSMLKFAKQRLAHTWWTRRVTMACHITFLNLMEH